MTAGVARGECYHDRHWRGIVRERHPAAEDEMKISRLWSVVAAFSGILSVGSAQETTSGLRIPSTVSVTTSKSRRIKPGESFTFLLTFNEAPRELEGGTVSARFERVSGPPPRFKVQDAEDHLILTSAQIHDGQKIYTLSQWVPSLAAPGTWKLVEVSISRRIIQQKYAVPDFSFEIPELLPMAVHIDASKSVEAGHEYVAMVRLDEYPKDMETNCIVHLNFRAKTPDSKREMDLGDIRLSPDQLSYKLSYQLDSEAPSGPWEGEATIRALVGDDRTACQYPPLEGNLRFSFKVEPDKNLVIPTSVVVTVNASQSELLVAEADRLRAKAAAIPRQLKPNDVDANRRFLLGALSEAIDDLDRTEKKYKEKETNPTSSSVVDAFFGDIRISYDEARAILDKKSARVPQSGWLVEVKADMDSPSQRVAVDAVVGSIKHNAAAYDLAALTLSLTFNLDVRSQPSDAIISYKHRGEEFKTYFNKTNTTLERLDRGQYTIRLQKLGYDDDCFPFDGMTSTETSVTRVLNVGGSKCP
jgi:hypothetical protein